MWSPTSKVTESHCSMILTEVSLHRHGWLIQGPLVIENFYPGSRGWFLWWHGPILKLPNESSQYKFIYGWKELTISNKRWSCWEIPKELGAKIKYVFLVIPCTARRCIKSFPGWLVLILNGCNLKQCEEVHLEGQPHLQGQNKTVKVTDALSQWLTKSVS